MNIIIITFNFKMNYDNYYKNQVLNPIVYSPIIQQGNGVGDVFKRFFKWIIPVIKENAKPILKNIGKTALKTANNIGHDVLDGKNIKASAKKRILESLNPINQSGSRVKKYKKSKKRPIKNKKSLIKIKKTKFNDIFD